MHNKTTINHYQPKLILNGNLQSWQVAQNASEVEGKTFIKKKKKESAQLDNSKD